MKTLPANLIIEKNKLATKSAWLIMLEITLNDEGSTQLHYVRNPESISFDGNIYQPFNFQIDQAAQESKGEIPMWTLRVANITRLLESYLQDLDGAIGSTVKITVVNSENLDQSYAELEKTFDVLACEDTGQWVSFTLGAPNLLRQRFPLNRFLALHCRFHFESAECSYARMSVADISLAGSDPVRVELDNHSFADDDVVRLADISGISPSLAGTWSASYIDSNTFSLQDTDSSSYSGSYSGGGTAGFNACNRTLIDCRDRLNTERFGGFPGIRSGGVRIA